MLGTLKIIGALLLIAVGMGVSTAYARNWDDIVGKGMGRHNKNDDL